MAEGRVIEVNEMGLPARHRGFLFISLGDG
jgi:hypothetical protein